VEEVGVVGEVVVVVVVVEVHNRLLLHRRVLMVCDNTEREPNVPNH